MIFLLPLVFSKICEHVPPIILEKTAQLSLYNETLTTFRTTSFEKKSIFNIYVTVNTTADVYVKTNGKCPNTLKVPEYTAKPNIELKIPIEPDGKNTPIIGILTDVNTTAHIRLPEFDHSEKIKSPSLIHKLLLFIISTIIVFQINKYIIKAF